MAKIEAADVFQAIEKRKKNNEECLVPENALSVEFYKGYALALEHIKEFVNVLDIGAEVIESLKSEGKFKEGYKQAIIDGKTQYQRPHGKWITIDVFVVKCSVCGVESFATPFCPRCGADMREDKNET